MRNQFGSGNPFSSGNNFGSGNSFSLNTPFGSSNPFNSSNSFGLCDNRSYKAGFGSDLAKPSLIYEIEADKLCKAGLGTRSIESNLAKPSTLPFSSSNNFRSNDSFCFQGTFDSSNPFRSNLAKSSEAGFGITSLGANSSIADSLSNKYSQVQDQVHKKLKSVDYMPESWSRLLIDFLKDQECSEFCRSKVTIKVNGKIFWIKANASAEGGSDTVFYGHKIRIVNGYDSILVDVPGYMKGNMYVSDEDAILVLKKDIDHAANVVKKNLDKFAKDPSKNIKKRYDQLNIKPQSLLTEIAFNVGSIEGWPNFVEAVINEDYSAAVKHCKRFYKDPKSQKKIPLERRNKAFEEMILKPLSEYSKQ